MNMELTAKTSEQRMATGTLSTQLLGDPFRHNLLAPMAGVAGHELQSHLIPLLGARPSSWYTEWEY